MQDIKLLTLYIQRLLLVVCGVLFIRCVVCGMLWGCFEFVSCFWAVVALFGFSWCVCVSILFRSCVGLYEDINRGQVKILNPFSGMQIS